MAQHTTLMPIQIWLAYLRIFGSICLWQGVRQEHIGIAQAALQSIQQTEQNKFYLNQIRKEETKSYYVQAKLAMSQEKCSLASQLLEKYRENVAKELSERKIQQRGCPFQGRTQRRCFGRKIS